ncbi:glyoxalase/bleomycin resistance/extradiol dioxygenase family protein [Brachybacterium sp. FME24]|uniref:VOC family protein n=1 Tax=Brachybacterium sp. FME24 TaxID=2742605 RepID=UPI00186643EE|nr:VOC family protein [Brachybacterium sp. FME24]
MTGIRALTLVLEDPSVAAAEFHDVLGWTVEADYGSFASVTSPDSIPLWINAPADGQATTRGVVVHVTCDDVDAAFAHAVTAGARVVREPTDMDFGERSACVAIAAAAGVTIDFSRPLG